MLRLPSIYFLTKQIHSVFSLSHRNQQFRKALALLKCISSLSWIKDLAVISSQDTMGRKVRADELSRKSWLAEVKLTRKAFCI